MDQSASDLIKKKFNMDLDSQINELLTAELSGEKLKEVLLDLVKIDLVKKEFDE